MKQKKLGARLSVNKVNSSCIMLEAVSLDRMSFSASSLTGLIPSFEFVSTVNRTPRKYPPLMPRNTLNEESTTVATELLYPQLGHVRSSKSGGVRNSSGLRRHRKGATSTCKKVSHLPCMPQGITDVFHAPKTRITGSRFLAAMAASVWYFLERM